MLLNAEQKCYLWLSAAEITPSRVQDLLQELREILGSEQVVLK